MTYSVFSTANNSNISQFKKLCEQHINKQEYPFAHDIINNVIIYDGDHLHQQSKEHKQAIQSEIYKALASGSGIIAIKNMWSDHQLLNQHNEIFNQILQEETVSGIAADHFAKAGANGRIWNSFQKVALKDADSFIDYYSNPLLSLVCQSWLGPYYQVTAQVNIVRPGGKAQQPHRDYHLGFQQEDDVALFPLPLQVMTQFMTLQGAVAHSDMPIQSGPTLLLPFSQQYKEGYLAWRKKEFIEYFNEHAIQVPLEKGDGLFFSPALFHGAGNNHLENFNRIANLLQISSVFCKPMETVNHTKILSNIYPSLLKKYQNNQLVHLEEIITAAADSYSFPTNLDTDPPVYGLAPMTQHQLVKTALTEGWDAQRFTQELNEINHKRQA
ncbi:Ectoine hydroxylase-related dioxygenase [Commensalibacter communis]|uniref:phytanoyl-CoA dioxygenase family protein n=1 Tax=Commensalibacter communis TaxID=2972786 RepID=UPI0022FF9AD5|nr:phytanoyl-CoA dioxygenase family protein [Commensalibacter communis]CAI3934282.1 Ectoine hydroxylase-related dioxygenase [Commensalibacter communis]